MYSGVGINLNIDWSDVCHEAEGEFVRYLQIDSSNPPTDFCQTLVSPNPTAGPGLPTAGYVLSPGSGGSDQDKMPLIPHIKNNSFS